MGPRPFLPRLLATCATAMLLAAVGAGAADRDFRLEPVWQTDPDGHPLFRDISRVLRDRQGRFVLLDARSLVVHRFDADGNWLDDATFGGSGPGEASSVRDIALDPAGNVLVLSPFGPAVIDPQASRSDVPGRYLAAAPGCDPALGLAIAGQDDRILIWSLGPYCGRRALVLQSAPRDFAGPGRVIATVPVPGRNAADFHEEDHLLGNYRPWCVTDDGDLYLAAAWTSPGPRYEIRRYRSDGASDLVFGAESGRRPRTRDESRRAEERLLGGPDMADLARRTHGGDPVRLSAFNPDVVQMFAVGDEIWVQPGTSDDLGTAFCRFDAFDRDGRFLGRVRLHWSGDRGKDRLDVFGDRAIVVKGMNDLMLSSPLGMVRDADPVQAVCTRLVPMEAP